MKGSKFKYQALRKEKNVITKTYFNKTVEQIVPRIERAFYLGTRDLQIGSTGKEIYLWQIMLKALGTENKE